MYSTIILSFIFETNRFGPNFTADKVITDNETELFGLKTLLF